MSKEFFQGIMNSVNPNPPVSTQAATQTSALTPTPTPQGIIVKSGDTLGRLGAQHGFDYNNAQIVRDGKSYNIGNGVGDINPNQIRVGDRVIPNLKTPNQIAIEDAIRAANEQGSERDVECISQCCGDIPLKDEDYMKVASELGIEKCMLKAIARKETGPQGAFNNDCKPTVLYEKHIFKRLTKNRYSKKYPHLSGPYGNHGLYSQQWPKLNEAMLIDKKAGIQSASWGLFQIMGFNYKACGYSSPEAFKAAMEKDQKEHLKALKSFLINCHEDMIPAMKRKDWHKIARIYNGPGYKRNDYHTDLERYYNDCKNQ